MKVIIAAGGSGGHIFPAIALGRDLLARGVGVKIMYVGSDKALDRRIFEREGACFRTISANKLAYKISPNIIIVLFKLTMDLFKCLALMVSYRPDVVVGFGGYVSFPVITSAKCLRIPTIVHEQNVVPGRANGILLRLADKVALSFEDTKKAMGGHSAKAVLTGNPVRCEILKGDRTHSLKRFGLDERKFTILIIGGSQGSAFLNRTFIDSISVIDASIRSSLQTIHITGVKDYEWARKAYDGLGIDYRVLSFIDRIEEAYASADLVVTRAGASAIFELAILRKPMILVPYPHARSHQLDNALVFAGHRAAIVIEEKDLSGDSFGQVLSSLVKDRNRLRELGNAAGDLAKPQASKALADEVISLKGR